MPDPSTDPLFDLLTDALRAGPGSPAWREAVAKLRESGDTSDEYSLLIAARERLESGRQWRSVRAGPGFTKKVMSAIDEQGPQSRGFPVALFIAVIALLVLTGIVVTAVFMSSQRGGDRSVVADVSNVLFTKPIISARFNGDIPIGWSYVGSLPLNGTEGLSPSTLPSSTMGYLGGGAVCDTTFNATSPFAIEAQLQIDHPSDDLIPQVFISDESSFSEDRGTSSHEFVWLVNADGMRVVQPDGRVNDTGQKIRGSQEPQLLRILVGRSGAIVEFGGKQIWQGPHQLRADRPWHIGVRFLAKPGAQLQRTMFQSVRVLKAEK